MVGGRMTRSGGAKDAEAAIEVPGLPRRLHARSVAASPPQDPAHDEVLRMIIDHEHISSFMQASAAFVIALLGRTHPQLARHSRHVAELVRSFAGHLRLTEEFKEELFTVGLFHDIGMLSRQSPAFSPIGLMEPSLVLDESDESHAVEGAKLVGLLPGFSRASTWIRHHHERYDGSGYPQGLRANSIPLGSRIIRIAEVYDKLCFEQGQNPEGAIRALFSEAGTDLDPQLVEGFAVFCSCDSLL